MYRCNGVSASLATALTAMVVVFGGSTALGADPPVTLRLGVADGQGRPSEAAVTAFVDAVASESHGTVTIEPVWTAGDDTPPGFEVGTGMVLKNGDVDLALVAGRAWHDLGNSALDALQAPFLIDNDALAVAVASSPVADQLLAGLSDVGVTGLAMWPEDLRHPVAFDSCTSPIVTPAQFGGLTVRAIQSAVTTELLTTLGATVVNPDNYGPLVDSCDIQAAESGLRQGASLPGQPTFTGDVTFYPKYQVLAANGKVFGGLTSDQQAAIRTAALTTRDEMLASHPTDVEAGADWCAGGGRVVLAGADADAAFEAAAKPVFDRLAADPVAGPAVEAIRQLKATTPASPGADACSPGPESSLEPIDTTGFTGTLPPSGTFRTTVTADELIAAGASPGFATNNAATWTLTFDGDQWNGSGSRPDRALMTCSGTMTSDGTKVVMNNEVDNGCGWYDVLVWRETGDGLDLRVLELTFPSYTPQDLKDERAANDRVWTRIEGDPAPMPS